MTARSNGDMSREVESHSASFSLQRFHDHIRAAMFVRNIEVGEAEDSKQALTCPQPNNGADVGKRRKLGDFQVNIDSENGREGESLVQVEESLVERMANDGR